MAKRGMDISALERYGPDRWGFRAAHTEPSGALRMALRHEESMRLGLLIAALLGLNLGALIVIAAIMLGFPG